MAVVKSESHQSRQSTLAPEHVERVGVCGCSGRLQPPHERAVVALALGQPVRIHVMQDLRKDEGEGAT